MYKYHPEIEGLKCNEDGSEIVYLGKSLNIQQVNRQSRKCDTLVVTVFRKVYTVGKLVCECWNGMADNPRWCATRKSADKGFHYTNLFWAPCGTNPAMGTNKVKRSSISKVKKEDIPVIEKRLKDGETLKAIAKDYGTSDMTISRIKKRME